MRWSTGSGLSRSPDPSASAVGTVSEDQDGDWTHLIRCEGGPLDGRGFEFETQDPAPWSVVILPRPGGGTVKYFRLTPRSSMRPGDAWTYRPVDDPRRDGPRPD